MKCLTQALIMLLFCIEGATQTHTKVETQIRDLEQKVVNAILVNDTQALKGLWAPEFQVNNPRNNISANRDSVMVAQKAGLIDYMKFERVIEQMQVKKKIVITMGHEMFIPRRDIPGAKAGQTHLRRFTNIWMKKNGQWKQIARHASIVCN